MVASLGPSLAYRSCAVGTVATVRFIKEAQKLGFTKRQRQ